MIQIRYSDIAVILLWSDGKWQPRHPELATPIHTEYLIKHGVLERDEHDLIRLTETGRAIVSIIRADQHDRDIIAFLAVRAKGTKKQVQHEDRRLDRLRRDGLVQGFTDMSLTEAGNKAWQHLQTLCFQFRSN